MTRLIVESPTVTPRRFGLYSVADVQEANANSHTMMGIEYEASLNCEWDLTRLSSAFCGPGQTKAKTEGYQGTSTFDPFALYALDECAGISSFPLAQKRAVDKFARGEERGVEAALYANLKANGAAVDLSPGTIPSIAKAIAILEDWVDTEYAGQGTLILNRGVTSLATKDETIKRHGNHLETELGNLVFGTGQIGASGPASASAGAGNTYMWVVGKVTVRRSPMFVSDPQFIQTAGANEVQTFQITGTPTGGTFTITFGTQTTANIAYNADAATVQAALVALSNVNAGDIVVTGTNPNFTFTFGGQYANADVPAVTTTRALTGGTSPNITVTTTTPGSGLSDNSYRTLAERGFVLDYDCLVAACKAVYA